MPKLLLITTDEILSAKLSKLLSACNFSLVQVADLSEQDYQADLVIYAPKKPLSLTINYSKHILCKLLLTGFY